MSSPFVFDVTAALDRLGKNTLSPVSPGCRQTSAHRFSDRDESASLPSVCEEKKNPPYRTVADSSSCQVSSLSPRLGQISELTEKQQYPLEERAAIKKFDAGILRSEAERQAKEEIMAALRGMSSRASDP